MKFKCVSGRLRCRQVLLALAKRQGDTYWQAKHAAAIQQLLASRQPRAEAAEKASRR